MDYETTIDGEHKPDFAATKNLVLAVYILYICSFFTGGITDIIGVVIAYVKRGDQPGTWLEDHFVWQINTFWISLGVAIIGLILLLVGIGVLVLFAVTIWNIYRIAKGMIRFNESKSPYNINNIVQFAQP
ncbi:hypothetical protein AGMMS50229_17030 [Campylobacterota bacterium]|nr:hypothetical protein AGMMS50229_17030 [Campylobacterota bacterium]